MISFGPIRYIQNSYVITFSRMIAVRRKANEVEDFLGERFGGDYGQAQMIPVPDEMDPEVPRLIFGSRHGFSQILVSQIGITLNAAHSPAWQQDTLKGRTWLQDRAAALYDLLKSLGDIPVCFSGFTTRAQLPLVGEDADLLRQLHQCVPNSLLDKPLHDWQLKLTTVKDDRFFSNVTTRNYRYWPATDLQTGLPRLSKRQTQESGLEILGDFNDRYAYHEDATYYSSPKVAQLIVEMGLQEVALSADSICRILDRESGG